MREDARACNSYTASELHCTVYNEAVSTYECNMCISNARIKIFSLNRNFCRNFVRYVFDLLHPEIYLQILTQ